MSSSTELCDLGACELLSGYAAKSFSPVEVMQAVLQRTEQINPRINAFFHVAAEASLEAAKASEKRWLSGAPTLELDGVPVTIKDSVAAVGMPSLRGAKANVGKPNPTVDSPPAARLREAGALLFAKTTMPDFGKLGAGVSSVHGVTRNPWGLDFNTSGSSAGAAAALAARLGPLAIGTDMAGSVRLPAALCGVVGLKTTLGRVPHLPPSAIRVAGPMARNVRDAALMLGVLARPDARDYGSLPAEDGDYVGRLASSLKGKRIGLLLDFGFGPALEPAVRQAVQAAAKCFADAGAHVELMPRLLDSDPMPSVRSYYDVLAHIEMEGLPADKRADVTPAIRAMSDRANGVTGIEHAKNMDVIEAARSRMMACCGAFDYVLSPVTPFVNFPAADIGPDPLDTFTTVPYTFLCNHTGQPAISVNCGFDARGLPIGLQIIGPRFDDLGVLRMAAAYEAMRNLEINWP